MQWLEIAVGMLEADRAAAGSRAGEGAEAAS